MLPIVLLGFVAALVSATTHIVESPCELLKRLLPSEIILRNETRYTEVANKNWATNARRAPSCIVVANNTRSLQEAVKNLTRNSIQFAIRSGGHMIKPGGSNIDNGVLIDLSRLNEIEYNAIGQVARVGGGARWGDVYKALEPHNVTVVGGRLDDIGVGGLILGGGLSWLSSRHGLACDNVVNFEVILANGTLINANATSSTDLYKALKGGGNNFGVVTHFTISTYAIGAVWGGIRYYAPEQFPALISAFSQYQLGPQDPDASIMIQAPLTNSSFGVLLNIAYSRPFADPPAFDVFKSIPIALDTTSIRSYSSLISGASNPDITQLPRWDWRTATLAANATLYTEVYNITTKAPELQSLSQLQSGTFVFNMQPIPVQTVKAAKALGGNSLGLSEEPQVWVQYLMAWWHEEDDHKAYSLSKAIMDRVNQAANKANDSLDYVFMNDASQDQNVISSYGRDNVISMKKVQEKYDSTKAFQELVRGGFKLP
ncbi:putative FAD-binding oxidoreductase [Cucurbitaria berberidis CBS 394.84]|uniref:FAD-binding oxidoreductase n=1 Tax=Cucurbitaria berberidis CBS 394.84 TaxID=1168544 RepID=A0A9P4L9B4_9PLEO|nr:putative FAD-binding oxidoreductase [Cucurbitaria berberidis CBS 394.84]KAF1846875.1 putative FAD-binding oxidoreductase [Cucurbitaria berberidis CBS 394.84]